MYSRLMRNSPTSLPPSLPSCPCPYLCLCPCPCPCPCLCLCPCLCVGLCASMIQAKKIALVSHMWVTKSIVTDAMGILPDEQVLHSCPPLVRVSPRLPLGYDATSAANAATVLIHAHTYGILYYAFVCVCVRAHTHMHTQHTHTHTQNNKQGKWEEVAIPTASISVLYYVFSTGDRGSVIVDLTVLAAASCHRINAHSPSHRHHHFPIPTPTRIHHHQTTFHGGHHTAIAAIPRVASQVDRLSLPSASASPPAPLPASEVSSG